MMNLQEAETWLREQAYNLVEQSIYVRDDDGCIIHLLSPVDRGMYQAIFLRDFVCKVVSLPELFAKKTTADTFDLFFENMNADFVHLNISTVMAVLNIGVLVPDHLLIIRQH